ncbi:SDR family NAD(P)-dependent oxidoreductase [Xanthomonas citri]|uniref:SDR family NAD(P)-dependent oxidoreductase n=1 Tax=Xanthomonas citri TaxID=346 RepID=UPI001FC92701|nr:SDR family NAD(P)-dependent oxidoreductase [Xanthomonas citri]
MVVLKRLDDALADGDHLHGVIRGSGINQDGATNGITAPSAVSQERLEREVYDRFGIDADGIQLVEAHGTGTKLGDPVEVHALTRAFRRDTARESYCAIGSIKSNLGHTTAAAGVASVLKVLLCLRHAQIAPSLHYEHRNRHIDLAGSPFQVATRLRPWHVAPGQIRRAAVSSFGLSGTNAHLVIEQAPAHARTTTPRPGYLWALSARSEAQLRQQVERLLAHLDAEPAIDCGNVAYTLLLGRRHFACRLTCVARHRDEFVQRLRTWLEHGRAPQVRTSCCTPLEDGGQAALKGYGNQCLRELGESLAANDYLDRLAAIAELFGQGYELDYASGFASQPHGRLSLPTYPFAPTPYWVEAPGTPPSAAKAEEAQAPEALSFQERWEPAVLPAATATPRRLLVIGADAAVATAAVAALGAAQAEAEIASVDGDAVAAAIEAEAGWEGIVYAGAWAGPADAAQGTAMYAAVQTLAAAGVTPGHLVLCAAYADGPSRAHAESWIGLARSLGVLVPGWTVTVLVGEGVAAEPGSDWAARVWTELAGGDGGAVHRAGAVRERLRVVAHALAAPVPTVRQGGVYWITGGAGGLGLHVARHLRERYAAKLVLSGRRALDEAARATLAAALGGTDWLYVAADVTDAAAMGAGVAEAVARWGAIEGVVHAAGVLDPAPLTAKTPSALAGVLAPKVRGSAVLDAVMAAQPLAFVCYFSSSAAVLGDFGGGDYAMGNRFQMAWAQWVAGPGAARRVAINWPLWAEGGMQAGSAEHTRLYLRSSGQVALPVAAGLAFFEQALGQPSGAYLLMHGQRARIEAILRGRGAASLTATAVPVDAARRPELRGLTVEACLHWELKQQVSELLKLPRAQIRVQDNLADFGFDSISLAQWARQLSAHYGVSLTPALFFSHATLSPREAELTDPQQRLFLETVWNLLEECGYTRERLRSTFGGSVGVYVGSMYSQYDHLSPSSPTVLQSFQSAIANRVSHYFGLNGPSVAVDTMCSSFAVALHQACADLRRGDVAMAIAGAVNLSLDAHKFVALSQALLLASRFDARSFADGDGYFPSETVGAVLLKPLRTAERDGDAIWGVVRATAVNHAGSGQAYSVPNGQAQVGVMRDVLRRANVEAGAIGYVEAAATGAAIGDAIEWGAIAQVFDGQPCAIGSVKSNMGHAEAASGFSQLAKVLLQLRHGERVPTIGSEPPNPNLSLDGTGLHLQRHREGWTRTRRQGREMPRLALINSFGAGGSNASLLVEEYRAAAVAPSRGVGVPGPQVIVLSGRTASGRRAVAARLADWLQADAGTDLVDLAYTLQEHREAMDWRLAMVARDVTELVGMLRRYLASADDGTPAWHEGDRHTASSTDAARGEGDAAERLAWAWVRHRPVDWSASRGIGPFRRLTLPTYPFERRRCWLPGEKAAETRLIDSDDTRTVVRAWLEHALRVPAGTLDDARVFREYGVDSVVGLGLVRALNDRFATRLGGRVLFDHPTIERLADHVDALRRQHPAAPPEGDGMRGALREFKAGRLTRDQLKARLERSTAA